METLVAVHRRCVLLPAMRAYWKCWRRFAIAAKHQAIYDHRIRTRRDRTLRIAVLRRQRLLLTRGLSVWRHAATTVTALGRALARHHARARTRTVWRQWARYVYHDTLEEQVAALAWVVQFRRAVTYMLRLLRKNQRRRMTAAVIRWQYVTSLARHGTFCLHRRIKCQAVIALLKRLVGKARTRRLHEAAAIAQYVAKLCADAVRIVLRCHTSAGTLATLLAQRHVRRAWARWVAVSCRRVPPPAPLRRKRWVPRSAPLKLKPTWRP
ncbi:hypothetical protein SDRG_10173 [Saprolegnia diclina VS20]|uniref:Sfi1 spindle body domain-containing protein n=1 Tax=Saprolegnia diclina (strain VS20) TaxID=1156394 RepID=T0Q3P3_SAPDV|nr:hypothetical protein SDRG_10173 [Saprolegnia diclina VS20]EQC32434.1 hypothetical protein SDRG_10173 [Saprolegnia diclina VS20]|eukprot:XP_008614375.1 hypothetical protein SDRG_10173 [Saprolegnia diclina VS20]